MPENSSIYCLAIFPMVLLSLTGCHRSDSDPAAKFQQIERRLDMLIGDIEESRKRLTKLRGKVEIASPVELEQLIAQKEELREALPVLAGIELSRELAELDWLTAVRQAISVNPTALSLFDGETLLAEVPAKLKDLAPSLSTAHASQTLQLAKELLESEPADDDELEIMLNLLSRLQSAEGLRGEDLLNLTQEIEAKLKILLNRRADTELRSIAESLQNQFESISKLTDNSLRYFALAGLSHEVNAARVRFVLENIAQAETSLEDLRSKIDEQLTFSMQALDREREGQLSKARMKYQAWALDQIQQMTTVLKGDSIDEELYFLRDKATSSKEPVIVGLAKYESVRQLLEQELGRLDNVLTLTKSQQAKIRQVIKSNWYPLVYRAKHDAAVKYLLPVNQNLLEGPVAKFYSEAFESAWQQIQDGDGLQLSLARKTAEVPKRSLESFLEENIK